MTWRSNLLKQIGNLNEVSDQESTPKKCSTVSDKYEAVSGLI
jgi:hypothetical protein